MRLILVRHGQTACNTNDIWHGWDECELTQIGLAQAEAVGARLAGEDLAAVHSSPSRRAYQTALAIARRHDLEPVPEPGLRERNAGEFEGVAVAEVEARHPTVWQERNANYWGWSPPGGETFRQVLQRAREVVDRLRRQYPNETVAVVTHMSTARVLISELAAIPIEDTYRMEFPSTGVTILSLDGETARVEALNDAVHVSYEP